jgi:long-chain acyl-CoA synthetase
MGIPQPIALVNLSESGKRKTRNELIRSLSRSLEHVNGGLDNFEKVHKIVVTREDWTIENGLLTPTLKIKRNELEGRHQSRYPEWFHRIDTVIWED